MQEMPYERFMAYGAASLTNAELIAVILRTGTSGASAVDLARRVLEIRGPGREALSVLYDLTMEDLTSIRGIGQVAPVPGGDVQAPVQGGGQAVPGLYLTGNGGPLLHGAAAP